MCCVALADARFAPKCRSCSSSMGCVCHPGQTNAASAAPPKRKQKQGQEGRREAVKAEAEEEVEAEAVGVRTRAALLGQRALRLCPARAQVKHNPHAAQAAWRMELLGAAAAAAGGGRSAWAAGMAGDAQHGSSTPPAAERAAPPHRSKVRKRGARGCVVLRGGKLHVARRVAQGGRSDGAGPLMCVCVCVQHKRVVACVCVCVCARLCAHIRSEDQGRVAANRAGRWAKCPLKGVRLQWAALSGHAWCDTSDHPPSNMICQRCVHVRAA